MLCVRRAGIDRTPKGSTEEDAWDPRDPQRLKGLGNEGSDVVRLDIALVIASRTERCLMAVFLHRIQIKARKAITINAKTISRPKPKAAFSPILKK